MVNDFIITGINAALIVSGACVGGYFLYKAWALRSDPDHLKTHMFVIMGFTIFIGGLSRLYYAPYYFARATGDKAMMEQVLEWKNLLLAVLVISAWFYILHLKPLFYKVSYRIWWAVSFLIVIGIISLGSLAAMALATFLNPV